MLPRRGYTRHPNTRRGMRRRLPDRQSCEMWCSVLDFGEYLGLIRNRTRHKKGRGCIRHNITPFTDWHVRGKKFLVVIVDFAASFYLVSEEVLFSHIKVFWLRNEGIGGGGRRVWGNEGHRWQAACDSLGSGAPGKSPHHVYMFCWSVMPLNLLMSTVCLMGFIEALFISVNGWHAYPATKRW